jgi:hypothetical protein
MRTTLLLLLRFDFFLTEGRWGRMVWDILHLIFEIFCGRGLWVDDLLGESSFVVIFS